MSQTDASPDLDRLDLAEVKRFLVRHRRLVLGTGAACTMLALLFCLLATPVFTATSQVLLDPRRSHLFGQDGVTQDVALDSSIVESQIPIILSTRLLAKVVTKENLADDPEFAASAKPGLLERLVSLFRSVKPKAADPPSLDGIDPLLAPAIIRLFGKVEVTRVAKSDVLAIAVSSRSAAKAARLANTIAQTYVEDQVDVHARSVQQAANFFEDRLGRLRDQVRASERAVADFRRTHGLSTTVMDGKVTVGEQQLQDLNAQLALATTDTAEKLARYQQAARFHGAGESPDTLPEIVRSTVVGQLWTQQADLLRRQADLTAVYGPSYPAITQIHAELAGLGKAISMEVRRVATALKNDYEVSRAREDALRRTIAKLSDNAGGDNEEGVKLRELERTNLANKALFENFLNRAKLTQEQSSFEEPDARLISPALEPSSPTSPKTKLVVPVAALAGVLLGLAAAAGRDLADRRSLPNAPLAASAFILAQVPLLRRRSGRPDSCLAAMSADTAGDFARSIESLASKLGRHGKAVVLVAPVSPAEGATSLALCCAQACGLAGRRVLLVDCATTRNEAGPTTRGLMEVLEGRCSVGEAIVRRERFDALAGSAWPPGRLVATTARLDEFLSQAARRYDLVILDGRPLGEEDEDTGVLLGRADEIVVVASWDHLMRDSFVSVVDRIAKRSNFLGVVLNRTGPGEAGGYAMAS